VEQAALGTFTGRKATEYGFTHVQVNKALGQPGNYYHVEVLFY
jgi:hypothetical protein